VIDDPKLAAALAGFSAQIAALKNAEGQLAAPAQGAVPTALVQAAETLKSAFANTTDQTITIASLDDGQFTALKKIAFADIAPFLTEPRMVVVGGNQVAKIAQGPSFLNDGKDADVTVLGLNAGALAAVIPAPQQQNNQPLSFGTSADPAALLQAQTAGNNGALSGPLAALIAAQSAKATGTPAAAQTGQTENAVVTGKAADETLLAGPATAQAPVQGPVLNAHTQRVIATAILSAARANEHPEGTNSESRGFGDILTSLTNTGESFKVSADGDFSGVLKGQVDQTVNANATSQLTTARSAAEAHPGMHLVSVALQRNLNPRGEAGTDRSFSITMEPGTLGRVKITLQFGEDNTVKAKLLAEKPETLALLQKDSGALDKILSSNGFDTSGADSMSFDLGSSDSFSQAMNDNGSQAQQQHQNSSGAGDFGTESALIETVVPIFVDPATGLTHVNITV